MKRFFLIFLLPIYFLKADSIAVIDEKFIHGKLPNGMIYYVRENNYPPQKAVLHLVVDAGSIDEDEDQKGIAHFVEHLQFRGSRNFKDGEIFEYLESIGLTDGADTNAFTGFESTEYFMDIPLKTGALDKGLLIMSNFAGLATLADEIIEKERNVVLDEYYRSHASSGYRLAAKQYSTFLAGSKYASHLPIGLKEVIEECPPERIREFYTRNYRPDRMAIIVVGDIQVQEALNLITKHFASIPCPEEPFDSSSRLDATLPKERVSMVFSDPELTYGGADLSTFYSSPNNEISTEEDLRAVLIHSFFMQLANDRLSKLRQEHPESIIGAGVIEYSLTRKISGFSLFASCFVDEIEAGLKNLSRAKENAVQFGFTQDEWDNVKAQLKTSWQTEIANLDKTEHHAYVDDCISHFLLNEPLLSKQWLFTYCLDLVDELKLEELNEAVAEWGTDFHPNISLTVHSAMQAEHLKEIDLFSLLKSDDPLTPYRASENMKLTISPQGELGTIADMQEDGDVIHWQFGNGIKVILKHTSLKKDEVILFGRAPKGLSSFSADQIDSAHLAASYAARSGLAGLNADQLEGYLSTRGIDLSYNINFNSRTVDATGNKMHVKVLFELVHALFTAHRFDMQKWENMLLRKEKSLKTRGNNPLSLFYDRWYEVNLSDYYLFRLIDTHKAEEAQAKAIFDRCFGFPQEFTFMIVGDFDLEEVKELTKTYLGSFPKQEVEPLPTLPIPDLLPKGELRERLEIGSTLHSETILTFACNLDEAAELFQNNYLLYSVQDILERRLTNILRKELGDTYFVSSYYHIPFSPRFENSTLRVHFSSRPKQIDKMVKLIHAEIEKIKMGLPTDQEIESVKEGYRNSRQSNLLSNSFWVSSIITSLEKQIPLDEVIAAEKRIEQISAEKVREAAQVLFFFPDYNLISLLPKSEPIP